MAGWQFWKTLFGADPRAADARRVHAVVPAEALQRLTACVTASEARHTGQVRLCIEARLPPSYVRREATARERAITLFGKLRVWDTEDNNGVLIYLLRSQHAIEIVADRGIDRHVPTTVWQDMVAGLSADLRAGRYEEGLRQAIEAVTAELARSYPRAPGAPRDNTLPDTPVVL